MTDFIVSSFRRKLRAAATAPTAVAAHRRDRRLFANLRWGRVIPLVAKADDALTKSPGAYCAPSLAAIAFVLRTALLVRSAMFKAEERAPGLRKRTKHEVSGTKRFELRAEYGVLRMQHAPRGQQDATRCA